MINNISGFLTFIEKYSKKHNCETELSFFTNQNKDENFYAEFSYIDKDENNAYFLDCKITKDEYYFDDISDYNAHILQELIDCMTEENGAILPHGIHINGKLYNYNNVKEFLIEEFTS